VATSSGKGGGVLELVATGYVEVDGTIEANGEDADDLYTGGGAGGSLYLTTAHFAGLYSRGIWCCKDLLFGRCRYAFYNLFDALLLKHCDLFIFIVSYHLKKIFYYINKV